MLGKTVREKVTGITGMCVARVEYLWGCVKFAVQQPGVDKDGKELPEYWYDLDRLVVVKDGPEYGEVKKVAITGSGNTPTKER